MPELQDNESRNPDAPSDLKTEARKELVARAEVRFGPRIGGASRRRFSKGGCTIIVITVVLAALIGLVVWGMQEKPPEIAYQPCRISDPLTGKWIGKRLYLRLPDNWSRESSTRFNGPGNARLEIQFGSMKFFHMHPRTLSGKLIVGRYTSAAYAYGLSLRLKKGEPAGSRYFSMPPFKGVEAWQNMPGGRVVRAFAVLLARGEGVMELRFYLPGGPDSNAWREADTIFRSLTGGLPPPSPPAPTVQPRSQTGQTGSGNPSRPRPPLTAP